MTHLCIVNDASGKVFFWDAPWLYDWIINL